MTRLAVSFEGIQTASVIRYPYLWVREAASGETEGRKSRPVVVGVRLARADGDLVLFFPITTKQPEPGRFAVEVPDIEKRRAGLDAALRLWIIFDEDNTDIVGQSFHLEPRSPDRAVQQGILPALGSRLHRLPQIPQGSKPKAVATFSDITISAGERIRGRLGRRERVPS